MKVKYLIAFLFALNIAGISEIGDMELYHCPFCLPIFMLMLMYYFFLSLKIYRP